LFRSAEPVNSAVKPAASATVMNSLARNTSDGAIFAIGGSTKCLIEAEISIGALYDPLQIGDVEVEPYAVAVIDHHPHRAVRAQYPTELAQRHDQIRDVMQNAGCVDVIDRRRFER